MADLVARRHTGYGEDLRLTDGSVVGQWRMQNVRELASLFDYELAAAALSNAAGTAHWKSDAAATAFHFSNGP